MADNIKVCIKIRPLIKREKESNALQHWKINNNYVINVDNPSNNFLFDYAFDENTTTRELFDVVVKPIVQSSLKGFNGTIFAYGQTSSGKTHTMSGTDDELGVIGLTVNEIFKEIESSTDREFLLRVGYIEIYNEKINDLLDKKNVDLKIHETSSGNVMVNCKECVTNTVEQIIEYMELGNKTKRIGETNMNDRSSRSHTIFRIIIESRECNKEDAITISQLNLVDLAGSERADQTGANSYRLKEGAHINKSLLSLSCVIQKLSENESVKYINYRDSKLTRILQASLGGNALTSIICTVTPASLDETMSTLNFAIRAKTIKNKPTINEEVSGETMTKRLKNEIIVLRNQLEVEKSKNSKILILKQISEKETQFIHSHANTEVDNKNRRRTWCPSSIPNNMSRLPVPQTISNGNVFLKPPVPPLNNDYINLRNRESMPILLSNDSFDEVFVPAEEIVFDKSPKFSKLISEIKTPETFKVSKIIATHTPDHISWKEKCELLEKELKELKDFTKLENNFDITEKLNDNYDKINFYEIEFAKMKSNLTKKDIQIDVVQTKCAEMEHKLTNVQNDLEKAFEEKVVAVKEKCLAENHKISLEYEFEQFKLNTKSRENDLLNCLNEKMLDVDIECLNNKVKELEAKLLKTEAINFSLQTETENINKILLNKEEIIKELDNALKNQQLSALPKLIECEASDMRDIIINLESNLKIYEIDKNIISDNNASSIANNLKNNSINDSNNDGTKIELSSNDEGGFKINRTINEFEEKLDTITTENNELKIKIKQLEANLLLTTENMKKSETFDVHVETDIDIDKEILTESNPLDENHITEANINYQLEYENLNKKLNKLKEENNTLQNEYNELSTELMDNIQENESFKETITNLNKKLEAYELSFNLEKEIYNKKLEQMNLSIEDLSKNNEKILCEKNTLNENLEKIEIEHKDTLSKLLIYEKQIETFKQSLLETETEYQIIKERNDELILAKDQLEETLTKKIILLEETINQLNINAMSETNDMDSLKEKYESLVEKLQEVETECQKSKDQYAEMTLANDESEKTLNSKIISLKENIGKLENDAVNDKNLLDSLQEDIKELNEEKKNNCEQLNESLSEKQQLEIYYNKLRNDYDILEGKLTEVEIEYNNTKDEYNELMQAKDELQINFNEKMVELEENINRFESNSIRDKECIACLEDKLKLFEEKKNMFDQCTSIEFGDKKQIEETNSKLMNDYDGLEKNLVEMETKMDNNTKVGDITEIPQEIINMDSNENEPLQNNSSCNMKITESLQGITENNVGEVSQDLEGSKSLEAMYNDLKLKYAIIEKKINEMIIEYNKTKEQLHESEDKHFDQPETVNSEIDLLQEKLTKFENIFVKYNEEVCDKHLIECKYNKLKDECKCLEDKYQKVETKYQLLKDDQLQENEEILISSEVFEMTNTESLKEKENLLDLYNEMTKEKKQLEINYEKLKEEYFVLEKKVINIEGEECEKRCLLLEAVESITDEKDKMSKIIESYSKKHTQYEMDIIAKNDLIDKIKIQCTCQENDNKLIEYRMVNLQKNVNEYEQKCYKLEAANQHLNKELNDMKDIMSANLTNYSLCQEKLQLALATLSASKEALQKEFNTSRENFQRTKIETDQTISTLNNQLESLQMKHDTNLKMYDELSIENTNLTETIDALKCENNKFETKIQDVESTVDITKDTINGLLYTLDKLNTDFNEKKISVNELKEKINEFDQNCVQVQAIRLQLDNCEKQKFCLQSQLDDYIKEKQANDEAIQNLTKKLITAEAEKSSYIEINKNLQNDNENIDSEIKQLNEKLIMITESKEELIRDTTIEKTKLINQLEVFKIKNAEVEAILEKELDKYQQQNQDLLDLVAKNEELLNKITEQQEMLYNCERLNQEQNETKSNIICELEAKLTKIPQLEEELNQTKIDKERIESKMNELDLLINGLNEKVKNLNNKLEDSKLIIEKQQNDLENHIKLNNETIEGCKIEINAKTKKIIDLQLKIDEDSNTIKKLNEDILILNIEKQQQCDSLTAEINKLKIHIEELTHNKEMCDAEILNLNSKNILLQERNENYDKSMNEQKILCEDYQKKNTLNKDQIKKLICRIDELVQREKELNDIKDKYQNYSEIDYDRLIAENCDLIKKMHEINAEYSLINNRYNDLEDEYNLLRNNFNAQNQSSIAIINQLTMEKEDIEQKTVQNELTLKSRHGLLVKQIHEIEKMHLFKINQYEKQVSELKNNETNLQESIKQHKNELKTTLKKYSAIETELNLLKLKALSPSNNDKLLELQSKLNNDRTETLEKEKDINTLLGENNELKNKNQHLILEIDNFRRMTINDRKSRRQSAHDEKRHLWDTREVETMTDKTSKNCRCHEMNIKINELKRDIVIKDAHINTMQLKYKNNPFKDEVMELKETIKKSDRIIQELRSEIGKTCNYCLKNNTNLYSSKCIQTTDIKLDGITPHGTIDIKEYDSLKANYSKLQGKYEQAKLVCINRKNTIDNNLEVQAYKRLLTESEQKLNKLKTGMGIPTGNIKASSKSVQTEKVDDLHEKYTLMKNIALSRKKKIAHLENVLDSFRSKNQFEELQ